MLASAAALLLVMGCGNTVDEGAGGSGAGEGVGGGAGGVAVECEAYRDEGPKGPAVTITIRNDLAQAIRLLSLPMCSFKEDYVVVSRSDGTPGAYPHEDSCAWAMTCEKKMDGMTCPGACGQPFALCLEPGEETQLSWPGYLYVPENPPSACDAGSSCPVARSAPAASYDLVADAATVAGSAADDCIVRESIAYGQAAATTIDYPATTAATLIFE